MNDLFATDAPYLLITRAALSMTSIFKKGLSRKGLTEIKPAYLGVLMCLWASEAMDEMVSKFGSEEGLRLTDLGRCAGLEPSTITGLIDRMERYGLVYRSSVSGDRRALKANLTDKGRDIRSEVLAAVEAMTREAFDGIDAESMDVTKKTLRKMMENAAKTGMADG